jgi:hypothetical protein
VGRRAGRKQSFDHMNSAALFGRRLTPSRNAFAKSSAVRVRPAAAGYGLAFNSASRHRPAPAAPSRHPRKIRRTYPSRNAFVRFASRFASESSHSRMTITPRSSRSSGSRSRFARASDGGGQATQNAPTRPISAVEWALIVPVRLSLAESQSERPFANPRRSDPP